MKYWPQDFIDLKTSALGFLIVEPSTKYFAHFSIYFKEITSTFKG